MTVKALYELAPEYAALEDELDAAGGEISPELMARFDAIAGELKDKLSACAFMIRNRQAESDKHAEEAKRQANRAAVLNRSAASLKQYVEYCLDMAGLAKIEGVVRLQANGQVSVAFDGEPEKLPEGFRRVIFGLDRDAALAAHAAGQPLPEGVRVERGRHVRILV